METAARMVTRDTWLRAVWEAMTAWVWRNHTHRILIYIALVVTVSLAVEVFDISLVGR